MMESNALKRFLDAQKLDYERAFSEIEKGRKQSHWMWYIFPQISGLGKSETARFFEINNLAEAKAFLEHAVLGSRLIEISRELLKLEGKSANQIFGSPDDQKLKSSMTLFALVAHDEKVFNQVLAKYFDGEKDQQTIRIVDLNQK
ncbi:DUF1810 domain-containing protein [Pedobacter yonginense]|uniref:DUF1810 domain-containing protein n=2 Tax=Pedobacter yonginense TaxID=651869 RepID=A0A317EWF3_9SPHI|nr:DUF1810 domain-containing protein [Pedobacter yonginense]